MFSFAQEYRADRAAERLRFRSGPVRRDGRAVVVDAAELVVGDLVLLETGDPSATRPHPDCSPRLSAWRSPPLCSASSPTRSPAAARPTGSAAWGWRGNPLLLWAVVFELGMLAVFLLLPPLPNLFGGTLPGALGWGLAALAVPAVWLADTIHKGLRAGRRQADG